MEIIRDFTPFEIALGIATVLAVAEILIFILEDEDGEG